MYFVVSDTIAREVAAQFVPVRVALTVSERRN